MTRARWTLLVLAAAFAGALLVHLAIPFVRHQEFVSLDYAVFARSHLELGYGATRLGHVTEMASERAFGPPTAASYYPNRPFLSSFVISLAYRIGGESEAVFRLCMIVLGTVSLLCFASVARRLCPPPWDLAAVPLFAFAPMFWYFTLCNVHMAFALCFSLAAWRLALDRLDGAAGRGRAAGLIAAVVLACLSDWTGYFGALSLLAMTAKRDRRLAVAVGVAAVSSFGLHLLHLKWIDPSGGLLAHFFRLPGERMALRVSVPGFLKSEAREALIYFTAPVCLAAVAGTILLIRDRREPAARASLCLALLALDEVLFPQWALLHDYLLFGASPFVAVAAVRGLRWLRERPGRWGRPATALLLAAAAVQSGVVMTNRLTRRGAAELSAEAGIATRAMTGPRERTLFAFDHLFVPAHYYSGRPVSGTCLIEGRMHLHSADRREVPISLEEWVRYLESGAGGVEWVVAIDPDEAMKQLRFFSDRDPSIRSVLPQFWIFPADHPSRQALDRRSVSCQKRGPFLFYRMK